METKEKYKAEEIIPKPREADVELGQVRSPGPVLPRCEGIQVNGDKPNPRLSHAPVQMRKARVKSTCIPIT